MFHGFEDYVDLGLTNPVKSNFNYGVGIKVCSNWPGTVVVTFEVFVANPLSTQI